MNVQIVNELEKKIRNFDLGKFSLNYTDCNIIHKLLFPTNFPVTPSIDLTKASVNSACTLNKAPRTMYITFENVVCLLAAREHQRSLRFRGSYFRSLLASGISTPKDEKTQTETTI